MRLWRVSEGERFPSGDALPHALDGGLVETNVENASMTADQFFSAVAQALAGLAVDIENGRMIVKQEKSVGCVVHEGAEASLARAQLFLRLLALGNVSRQAQDLTSAFLEMAAPDLDRKIGPILTPVAGLECQRFPCVEALPQLFEGRFVQAGIEIAWMHPDQFFPAVAQAMAGLAVDVENDRLIVKQEERVRCVVHERAEALLAGADLFLGVPQLRNVLQDPKLAQRPSRVVPCDLPLAMYNSHLAVGADYAVFDVVAWTAAHRGRSGLGYSRAVVGVN